ncbi:dATP/dGTP pyrophosphohydrolase domain-containing protein [Pseudomonas aeruginosa]|uniref:dATP/dGTP pyrophosphohydrolase domain-containing protein n=1 Tax=Pseudomonas aeruginosa TaxID=287 RepID=UPI000ADC477D|nr:dATP/dGTP pyrophosphohydrolase domain-containing protein [Pseudomonas aeruginosa]
MTTNQNHPDDHLAIEALHSRYLDVLTGRTSDHLLMLQDEAYALGRARGRLDVFRFDLHLERQRRFSERTFGPGSRAAGVVDHIRKELREIEEAPGDLAEWIDVVILALDGAWRTGATPAQIIDALVAKQTKNESRTWLDKGAERGTWVESPRMPAFDQQHPEAYAKLQQLDQAKPGAQHRLALAKEGEA